MEINILGTKYDLKFIDAPDETMQYCDSCGYMDKTTKQIVVLRLKKDKPCDNDMPDKEIKVTVIHEIIHAFLFESGIEFGTLFHNEEMVQWLAMQFSKISQVIRDIEP